MNGKQIFFTGIGGSGMNSIARIMHQKGYQISGSDREYDAGKRHEFYSEMIHTGISLYPQDGSGIHKGLNCVVASTAVESQIPDLIRARQLVIPVIHRSEALARLVENNKSIAVAGTSGKSTVTGMGAWALSMAGYDPTVVNGAKILKIGPSGTDTDYLCGNGEWAIFEADESDGSLIRFKPDIGLLTNISKDHKPVPDLLDIFRSYAANINDCLIYNASCSYCRDVAKNAIKTSSFGYDSDADFQIMHPRVSGMHAECIVEGHRLTIELPGIHNLENAISVFVLLRCMGKNAEQAINALKGFRGIQRRFQIVGSVKGITVVDDFAHNPDKIRATMNVLNDLTGRVLYVFQPHGYGPTRFLFDDFINQFELSLRSEDLLFILPIFYAGGTAEKTVSSEDIARSLVTRGKHACFIRRSELPKRITTDSESGDWVVVMGARDPSLSELCQTILSQIAKNSCE